MLCAPHWHNIVGPDILTISDRASHKQGIALAASRNVPQQGYGKAG